MAREGGIERINACKKHYMSLSLLHTGLGLSLLFAEGLELDEKTHWQIHRHAPWSACVSLLCVCVCVCVCVSLYVWVHVCISVFVCVRHTPPQPCSLRISLQEWDPTRICNTFSFLPFKQVAGCFNKDTWISSELRSRSTELQYIAYPITVSCLAETNGLIHPLEGFLVWLNCLDWSCLMVL